MSKYPDLINTLAIIQGETYLKLLDGAITVSGDWTGVTPRGQIRDTYLNDSEILYAEFEFEESVYDEETDTTTIKPFLSASVTQNIPYTKWREGQVFAPKKNVHVYDIEIEKGSVVKKLAFGYVQVIGEITGSGAPIENKETFLIASNNLSEITDPATARTNLEIVGGVKPDWNAEPGSNEEILNQPDLTQYATTTALSEGLATKQSVGNYLDTNDIGVSVQPFSVNTVIDPNYVATEESFTTAEKTALGTALQPDDIAGLAPLTSPNLTGTPTAPTAPQGTDTTQLATTAFVLANAGGGIENGIVINGVANFWQSTPPTTRGDGSALVDGDVWYKPGDKMWIRKGIYWVSEQLRLTFYWFPTAFPAFNRPGLCPKNIYVESFYLHYQNSSVPDVTNNHVFTVGTTAGNGGSPSLVFSTINVFSDLPVESGGNEYYFVKNVETAYLGLPINRRNFSVGVTRNGVLGNPGVIPALVYREIYS